MFLKLKKKKSVHKTFNFLPSVNNPENCGRKVESVPHKKWFHPDCYPPRLMDPCILPAKMSDAGATKK